MMLLLGLVLLLGFALTVGCPIARGAGTCEVDTTELALHEEEQELWRLINNYRQQNGRTRLVWTPSLAQSSTFMATDMSYVPGSTLSHTDRQQRGPIPRMKDCGYVVSPWMGENIAAGYSTGAQVFNGWKGSPGHNYVMMQPELRVGGVAMIIRAGSSWSTYWALNLGGEGESVNGVTVHPGTRWRWSCPQNVCERIVISP